ncbi:MAG: RNA degradosome polyphosphate kinase [Pseudomonadota bacterium]|nr:RNA degradosome polyphosphate kinase [Pseudomonadota bacterium]MDE3037243.1 RNA degradosome polyphosphate kinase [Pseudomonadota bacterium]
MPEKKTESVLAQSRERFINRETSWLAFNSRVLDEACNPHTPLIERLNFLAISSSNLDEFYMIRVAGLKDYVQQGITKPSADGLTPAQELDTIHKSVSAMVDRQHEAWIELRGKLKDEGIVIVKQDEMTPKEKTWLEEYFLENIFPVLTPIAIDPAHPFPFLPNLGLALIFQLAANAPAKEEIAIVPLPARLSRFILLPGEGLRYVMLEEAIGMFLSMLMPGFTKTDSALFRIIRDSELDVEEEGEDFVRNFERAVKQRRRGRVIQVKFEMPVSKRLSQFVSEQMHVDMADVVEVSGMLGLANLKELYEHAPGQLKYPPFQVRFPERINDFGGDCFAAIAAKDIVIHHPFETFDVVIQFLKQAAEDPDVVSIKQTLYRTSKDSPIPRMLIAAAEAGKSVTALVELKARFDEEANLRWARDLEAAGVQVVYGFVALKTHAKVTLVTRREAGQLKSYVHFGTGNYHPTTAKIYTDLSFFTCDHDLCRDAAYLFNFVTGYAPPRAFKKLIIAPRDMRKRLVSLIEAEIQHVNAGRPGAIWAKMNSLVDEQIIDALYNASQHGVIVELVVRGICCLRPGVPGLSDNIRVKSIIGRFLEHARIYCFGAGYGLPSPETKVFIGSADWMPRNFDWRVEVIVPIENPTVHEQVMGQIMVANLKDERQSWVLQPDGGYKRLPHTEHSLSAHEYFINNPSLSGRGKGLKKAKDTQMLKVAKAGAEKK